MCGYNEGMFLAASDVQIPRGVPRLSSGAWKCTVKSNPTTWKASNIDTLQDRWKQLLALYIILVLPSIKQRELLLIWMSIVERILKQAEYFTLYPVLHNVLCLQREAEVGEAVGFPPSRVSKHNEFCFHGSFGSNVLDCQLNNLSLSRCFHYWAIFNHSALIGPMSSGWWAVVDTDGKLLRIKSQGNISHFNRHVFD